MVARRHSPRTQATVHARVGKRDGRIRGAPANDWRRHSQQQRRRPGAGVLQPAELVQADESRRKEGICNSSMSRHTRSRTRLCSGNW